MVEEVFGLGYVVSELCVEEVGFNRKGRWGVAKGAEGFKSSEVRVKNTEVIYRLDLILNSEF